MKYLLTLLLCAGTSIHCLATAADSALLRKHVTTLCTLPGGHRQFSDTVTLNKAARYIYDAFRQQTDSTGVQTYTVQGRQYRNIIASFGPATAPRIVVGAHYDVCGPHPGADDNASGVAGLLELARLLHQQDIRNWKYRIDLVAFTLEEPPIFRTSGMGSAVHARYLKEQNISVKGMISLEMIGYYRDGKHTQHFPAGFLKLFYGSRGNFITVVQKLHGGRFVRQFRRGFRKGAGVRVKVFKGPASIEGIDYSDHLNYWAEGWDALMITDTSFFRNANYHQAGDTPDTLDYARMSAVVNKVLRSLVRMSA